MVKRDSRRSVKEKNEMSGGSTVVQVVYGQAKAATRIDHFLSQRATVRTGQARQDLQVGLPCNR